jgi:hypothetical protein
MAAAAAAAVPLRRGRRGALDHARAQLVALVLAAVAEILDAGFFGPVNDRTRG